MKKILAVIIGVGALVFSHIGTAEATSFQLPDSFGSKGLAVNPLNNHIFVSVAVGGEEYNNLYEFDPFGNLLYSTRVPFSAGTEGTTFLMDMATVADNGHLFAKFQYNNSPSPREYFILEMSLDGNTIYNNFSTPADPIGISKNIAYNPSSNSLLTLNPSDQTVYMMGLDTVIYDSFSIAEAYRYFQLKWRESSAYYNFLKGISYDPFSDNIYIFSLRTFKNSNWGFPFPPLLLFEYSKDNQGDYLLNQVLDLDFFNMNNINSTDINRTTGDFYFTNGNSVICLTREELFTNSTIYTRKESNDIPVPEPTTMLLLGTGLVGVAGAARRRKKK